MRRIVFDVNDSRWFYRILPAALHEPFAQIKSELITNQWDKSEPNPNQTRWKPFHIPAVEDEKKDFLDVRRRMTCRSMDSFVFL